MTGSLSAHQIDRMLDELLQNGKPVAHAAGAAGEIDDEGRAADAGEAAGERGSGKRG